MFRWRNTEPSDPRTDSIDVKKNIELRSDIEALNAILQESLLGVWGIEQPPVVALTGEARALLVRIAKVVYEILPSLEKEGLAEFNEQLLKKFQDIEENVMSEVTNAGVLPPIREEEGTPAPVRALFLDDQYNGAELEEVGTSDDSNVDGYWSAGDSSSTPITCEASGDTCHSHEDSSDLSLTKKESQRHRNSKSIQSDSSFAIDSVPANSGGGGPSTAISTSSQSFNVDVETEYNRMSLYFDAHTVAAGNPAVLFAIRRIVENSFTHGNQAKVIDLMDPLVMLLEAKSSFAVTYAQSVQNNAESVPSIGREMTMGDIAHHLGRNTNSSGDEVDSNDELLDLILAAIDDRNENSEERIRVDSYCSMNRALKNQLVVFVDICIAINAMSILRLSTFCSSHLLAKVKELVDDSKYCADMTMKCFTEEIIIPILHSGDTPKVKAAIEITCEMRKNMTDDILRPIFEPAQNMRFGGRGSGNGIDHCGGEGKQKAVRRATIVNLYLMLALAYVIEKEFHNGFFKRYGSFAGTILRSSWREIERASRPFLNREFFSILGYNYDKSKQTSYLEGLMRNNVKEGMPLVIIDQDQLECLQTLCQTLCMADTI
jgi:hypothetical protein